MPRPTIESIYPLTASQQGMLLETFRARSGIHVEQSVFELHGELDTARFHQAWRTVVARHAILRSAFSWESQAEPVQVVLREVDLAMTVEDWRDQPAAHHAQRLDDFLAADRARGFSVKRAPLIRLSLLRTADRVCRFVFGFHHIILDGWSLSLLLGEAIAIYEALARGVAPALPPPVPYRTYVTWVRERDVAPAQRYWNHYLRGFTRPTPLGREQPCEADRPDGYGELLIRIDETVSKTIAALARQHRVTPGLVFQGLWGLVLARYSGSRDVLFGTTVSGRPADLPGALAAVGLFINSVPMRLATPADAPVWPWLVQVQADHAAGRDFEYCSTGQIHRWRDTGAAALYDSLLVFENYPEHAAADASLRIDALESRTIGARTGFAATLLIGARAGYWIKLIYQRRRFDDAAAPVIVGHLRALVERIAADPAVRLGALIDSIPDAEIPAVHSLPAVLSPELRRWVAPREVTELRLASLWQAILHCDAVGAYDNFFDLGGHSLLALDLMARIEDEFGVRLPMSALLEHPTIEAVARALRERGEARPWTPLVPIRAIGSRPPVFCVPGAAIDAISLHPLAHALGDDQPFYGIQPRGLDGLLAPHATVAEMAAEVVEVMRATQPRGPYYIAGHSFGAHVAYEVSQQLGDAGCEVGLLVLLDAEASTVGLAPAVPARTDTDRLGLLLSLVQRFFGREITLPVDPTGGFAPRPAGRAGRVPTPHLAPLDPTGSFAPRPAGRAGRVPTPHLASLDP
ncbi:MAG TPA: condensation domain-containing protein, partial [Kofleriaceae bacterium]|nr:condensation domain-containing protein [Kofleriaceae bacterium]